MMRPTDGLAASVTVWSVWLRLATATDDAQRTPKAVLALLRRACDTLNQRAAPLQALVASWLSSGIFTSDAVRQLTPSLVSLPATPLEAYEALIAAASDEDNQCVPDPFAALTSAKNGKGAAAARRETRALYEAAVSEHGEVGVSVWLSYCLWHYHRAEFAEASNVHARALRALSPGLHAAFVEGYAGVAGAYA